MKNKKTLAIILYAVYAVALVLIITFASSLSSGIIYKLEVMFSKKNITDVTVDISDDTELLAGRYYYPQYTPTGSFSGSPGLRYASLDPEYLTVGDDGKVSASTDFPGDTFLGRVLVTSAYCEDFEKVITFRFVKKYPENFSVSYSVKGIGDESAELTVGVPVYVFSEIASGSVYNVSDHTLIYDSEYFVEGGDGSLIPTRPTDSGVTLAFSIEYGNGAIASSKSFTVKTAEEVCEFDEVLLNGVVANEFVGEKDKSISITLLKDGEAVATDYTLSLDMKGDANRDGKGGMYFLTVGDKGITVTLPGGYSKTVYPKIRNTVLRPILKDEEEESTHEIYLLVSEYKTVNFYFDGAVGYDTVEYEFDEEMMRLGSSARSFTIKPKKTGTTTLTLTIDDGCTRVSEEYTVHIGINLNPIYLISSNVSNFVSKVLGHMSAFVVLAFASMNLFKYVTVENKFKRFLLYSLTSLSVGSLTEIIQLFLPNRNGGVTDVILDMLGFYLGTLLIILYRYSKKVFITKILKKDGNGEICREKQ